MFELGLIVGFASAAVLFGFFTILGYRIAQAHTAQDDDD